MLLLAMFQPTEPHVFGQCLNDTRIGQRIKLQWAAECARNDQRLEAGGMGACSTRGRWQALLALELVLWLAAKFEVQRTREVCTSGLCGIDVCRQALVFGHRVHSCALWCRFSDTQPARFRAFRHLRATVPASGER